MIYLVLLIVLVLLGIAWKDSKVIMVVLYATVFFVVTHVKAGFDLNNYEETYNLTIPAADFSDRSFLFSIFMLYMKEIGLSFFHFRILCFFLCSSSILLVIFRFAKHPTLAFACCVFFPIMSFASQMRNGLAVTFVYLALFFLLTRKDLKGKLLFCILIVIGGLFHNVAFIYLLSLLPYSKIPTKVLLFFSLSFIVVSSFILQSGLLHMLSAAFLGDYYADHYFEGMEGFQIRHFFLFTGILINCWLSCNYSKIVKNHINVFNSSDVTYASFVERFNIVFLMLIPLLLISSSFYRVFQNTIILTPILLSIVISCSDKIIKPQFIKIGYLLFYFCLSFYYIYWQGGAMEGFMSI